jgi:hypothetical protein
MSVLVFEQMRPAWAGEDLSDQCRQPAAPVKTAQLELSPVDELESGAREQVADGGGDHDFARLRYAENPRRGVDRNPSDLLTLELHFTGMDSGASGEAVCGGGVDHGRRTAHRTGRAVEEDEETVTGGLRLASTKALDLGAHCLVVLG